MVDADAGVGVIGQAWLHHRTLWLGTMKAVVLGGSEWLPKYLKAATMTMRRAMTASRSTCLGS
jgi:hypothetical protein